MSSHLTLSYLSTECTTFFVHCMNYFQYGEIRCLTKDLGVLQTLQLLVAKPLLSLESKCKYIKRIDDSVKKIKRRHVTSLKVHISCIPPCTCLLCSEASTKMVVAARRSAAVAWRLASVCCVASTSAPASGGPSSAAPPCSVSWGHVTSSQENIKEGPHK